MGPELGEFGRTNDFFANFCLHHLLRSLKDCTFRLHHFYKCAREKFLASHFFALTRTPNSSKVSIFLPFYIFLVVTSRLIRAFLASCEGRKNRCHFCKSLVTTTTSQSGRAFRRLLLHEEGQAAQSANWR